MVIFGTSGVNFTIVLRTAFALVDPERVRTQSSCQYLFTLLGSTMVKALHRMLMKSTPGGNFINILHTHFRAEVKRHIVYSFLPQEY